MLLQDEIDILCICETWLDSLVDSKFIHIPNFNVTRCDAGRGAGVCIYSRDSLKIKVLDTGLGKVDNVEDVWLQVQHKNFSSFIIGCVYRHPKALVESFSYLSSIFRNMCLQKKPIFILGDFNDNFFANGNHMSKICKNLNLIQIIEKPTRITQQSRTLLDLIITNRVDMIVQSDVSPSTIADHEAISMLINIRKPKNKPEIRTYRCCKNYTSNIFCNLLLNETPSLNKILSTDDVNIQVDILTGTFNSSLDECAPIVTREITRPFSPWIDQTLKNIIDNKNELKYILKSDRTNTSLNDQFKFAKQRVENLLRNAKKDHFKSKFEKSKGNSGATWKVVEEMIPGIRNNSKRVEHDEPLLKAEEFNEYFANVGEVAFQKSREGIRNTIVRTPVNNTRPNLEKFRPQPVDIHTVILVFKELNDTNAFGPDGIPLRFLRDALPVLIFYIFIIINTSIVTGIFPKLWKHPYVIPFFKSGDTDNVSNYRPISLLPILSKILEKIVANQLMAFLESNRLLANSQHGFRKHLSTETALMKVNEYIYNNIDNRNISLLLLLDLSKAFDSVSHEILMHKFDSHSIDQFWFRNYLSDRTQSVKINSVISSSKQVKYGVPQGSILGPILFLIYINDMSQILNSYFLIQYADDTQIILSGKVNDIKELVERGERALGDAKKYFQENGLNVNENKTQCIFIGSRQLISQIPVDIKIYFEETAIIPSKKVKNLGIYIDQYLLFDDHISHISRKVNGVLIALNRIKDRLDRTTRVTIVLSLSMSIINYCLKVWGMTTKEQIERAQKLQNFAARVAHGEIRKYEHITPVIKQLEWLRIENKIEYDICIFTYKICNNLLPEWLFSFPTLREVNSRNTRQSSKLCIPRTKTDMGARAITVSGPRVWNAVPTIIQNQLTLKAFKDKLKAHFLDM